MATGLIPARNDALMRFAFPSGNSSISLVVLSETDTDAPFPDVPATGAIVPLFFAFSWLRRLISMVTASNNLRSWTSSRYLSERGRSVGSVIRAGGGAPAVDPDAVWDGGFRIVDGARFRGLAPPIDQRWPTAAIGARALHQQRLCWRLPGRGSAPSRSSTGDKAALETKILDARSVTWWTLKAGPQRCGSPDAVQSLAGWNGKLWGRGGEPFRLRLEWRVLWNLSMWSVHRQWFDRAEALTLTMAAGRPLGWPGRRREAGLISSGT